MAAARRVTFRAATKYSDSQKEAYEWILDKFIAARPDVLEDPVSQKNICEGRGRRFLDRDPQNLWTKSPHLYDERLFKKLAHGWYANTNLDEASKLAVLRRFSQAAAFEEGKDWSWRDA